VSDAILAGVLGITQASCGERACGGFLSHARDSVAGGAPSDADSICSLGHGESRLEGGE
jgi:hypothetical protein